jgi:hypothetical protein
MPSPRFEVPAGLVNGVNTVFTVSMPYGPGTTAVFLNGLLLERSLDDGWFETDPDLGIVTLNEAPRSIGAPDVIQIFYMDRSPALPETMIFRLKGIIRASKGITAKFNPVQSMVGRLESAQQLSGRLVERKDLRGSLTTRPSLKGYIKECI